MNNDLIQWPRAKYWTKAFNPFVGCKKISEGCQNCYAERVTAKFGINGGNFAPEFMPNARPPKNGVVFVGNMTDIFGHWVPTSTLWDIFESLSLDAVNLILSKRADRLDAVTNLWLADEKGKHLYFGITCENQDRFSERHLHIARACCSKRWLSLEPLLSDIDMNVNVGIEYPSNEGRGFDFLELIDWVVVGAESGPNMRECKIKWVERIVHDCRAAGVPVFVKQLHINGKLVTDINKFPEHLRIRQVPWIGRNKQ